MSFKTILVPLDGTASAATALPLARSLAKVNDASLVLIRCVPADHSVGEAEHYLQSVASELSDCSVRRVVRHGSPAEELVSAIRDEAADLVVMATHGRVGLQRALLGSVAEHVVKASPVPVALVRPGGKQTSQLKKLLVPTDGTAGAALALGTAIGLARSAGARVTLIEAVEPYPLWLYGGDFGLAPTYVDPSWDEDALRAAQTYVSGVVARLNAEGLAAEGTARLGGTLAIIEAAADEADADLIVMSTHGYTGPARAVLGSTADALVRTAKRPVLLVRRPAGGVDQVPANAGHLASV
jgi:nucleotide-binding universal stress UspA family protein